MFKELFTEAQHPGLKKFKEFEKLLSRSKGHYEVDLKNGNFVATFDNEDDAYNFDMSAMKVIRNKPNPEAWDIDSLNKEVIIMSENLTESKKIILKGSESKVQAAMDRLQAWNEKNSYPFQEYTSYTKDYRNYVIEIEDIDGYNKHKKVIDELIKENEELSESIKSMYSKLSKMNMRKLTKFAAANTTGTDVLNGLDSSDDVVSVIMDYFYHDTDWFGAISSMIESKPEVVETYEKLKDWKLSALKGYARKIGLPAEIIRDLKHEEMALDEIMDFLYNDDWLRDLMRAGVI